MNACVLDTDVVIAALDRTDAHHRRATQALRALVQHETRLTMSLINYAEALVRPADDDAALGIAIRAIGAMGIALDSPSPHVARDAARFRAQGVSLADGFAIATARAREAQLATFDKRVRRVLKPAGIALAPGFS